MCLVLLPYVLKRGVINLLKARFHDAGGIELWSRVVKDMGSGARLPGFALSLTLGEMLNFSVPCLSYKKRWNYCLPQGCCEAWGEGTRVHQTHSKHLIMLGVIIDNNNTCVRLWINHFCYSLHSQGRRVMT